MKKWISLLLILSLLSLTACGEKTVAETKAPETIPTEAEKPLTAVDMVAPTDPVLEGEIVEITLEDNSISVAGDHPGVYVSNDIVYYEDRDAYESGNPYGEGEAADKHTAEEANAHVVVNITESGNYRITGKLDLGQIRVDLGITAYDDPEAVVNLILDNADITCTVAPAILFKNVYECDGNWSEEMAKPDVDTTAAGANLILSGENTVNGSYVAKIYKDAAGEKKLCKQDGAIYSYMSMNVAGTGTLNLNAENEGLDTELHLTINGGNINIRSGNDGINTNEDNVSVTTINGGNVHIIAGLGQEGDGIDSNGYLVINGGTVVSMAKPISDAGLDSDLGSYIHGGIVIALGSAMDWAESDSRQVTMNLQFAANQASGSAIVVQRQSGTVVFAYDPATDEVLGENARQYMGAIISTPYFAKGDSYEVYIGGKITGTENGGVYDVMTVTGTEGGVKQGYTGTDVGRGFGGMNFGGMDFSGMDFSQMGEMSREDMESFQEAMKDFVPDGTMPEGMQMPGGFDFGNMEGFSKPEGGFEKGDRGNFDPSQQGQRPGKPDGEQGGNRENFTPGQKPDSENGAGWANFNPGQMPGGFGGATVVFGESNYLFYMQDQVNSFSGVAPYMAE